jgi:hypothetical protein
VSAPGVVATTVALLWPGTPGRRAYRVLPSPTSPHFLVPERPRRAAAAGLRAVRESRTWQARTRTSLACAAFRGVPRLTLPGSRVMVGDDGIDARLCDDLGTDVVATVHLGPARANRKPVLALTSPDGQVRGFAKVAIDALTASLVSTEQEALVALTGVQHEAFTAPQLVAAGTWQGRPYAVQSPLPLHSRTPAADSDERLVSAQVELARAFGTTTEPALDSGYVRELVDRLQAEGATGEALADAVLAGPALHDVELEHGAWHGDWRSTNCAVTTSTVLVWDWERFGSGVPLGYDALHLWLTSHAPRHADLRTLAGALDAAAPALLAPFGIAATQASATTTLYLAELGGRYLADRQHETAARLGDVAAWVLPHLQERAAVGRR